jgi:hypothetical protein
MPDGQAQRRLAQTVFGVDIGPSIDQEPNYSNIALTRSVVQWCGLPIITSVNVSPTLN